jgi:hypothetical protein
MFIIQKNLFFLLLIFVCASLHGQIGGNATYEFLNITNSARSAALGGKIIAINDSDVNLASMNPALLTPGTDKNLSLNYINYFTGINYCYVTYAFDKKETGTFAGGIQYVDYGQFIAADNTGKITGSFGANEIACYLTWAHPIDSFFRWGITAKPVYSQLESYTSIGLVTDFGLTYTNRDGLFTASIVVRNLGNQIKTYSQNDFEPMPTELMAGFSKKLEHAPFRFSLMAQHLEHLKMVYTVPSANENAVLNGEATNQPTVLGNLGDNILRHIIAGVEFMPSKSFYVALSYNYQRRQELQFTDSPGFVGFSGGFGLRIRKYQISYGYATYHLAGGSNHFTITTNLGEFYHR